MSRLVYLTICLLLMLLLHLQWSLQIITMPRYMLNRSGDILCAFKFPSSKLCGGPYGMNDRYGSNCTATGSLLWICVMFTLFSHCPGKQMLLKSGLQKAGIPILNLQPLPKSHLKGKLIQFRMLNNISSKIIVHYAALT